MLSYQWHHSSHNLRTSLGFRPHIGLRPQIWRTWLLQCCICTAVIKAIRNAFLAKSRQTVPGVTSRPRVIHVLSDMSDLRVFHMQIKQAEIYKSNILCAGSIPKYKGFDIDHIDGLVQDCSISILENKRLTKQFGFTAHFILPLRFLSTPNPVDNLDVPIKLPTWCMAKLIRLQNRLWTKYEQLCCICLETGLFKVALTFLIMIYLVLIQACHTSWWTYKP